MAIFEVGKSYEMNDPGFDPITVTRRTDKTIWVTSGKSKWKMRVRQDNDGNEFVTDSSVPKGYRDSHTYSSKWEAE